jgi:hypothetical protein
MLGKASVRSRKQLIDVTDGTFSTEAKQSFRTIKQLFLRTVTQSLQVSELTRSAKADFTRVFPYTHSGGPLAINPRQRSAATAAD